MSNKVILLVEDDPDDELLTLLALNQSELVSEIRVMRDGQEALDYLFGTGSHQGRDLSAMPAVILLDLNLPKVNGLEVLRRLRADERTKLLPVVILTSSTEQQDIIQCYSRGANSYISKSVDFEKFTEIARELKRYWLQLNQAPPVLGGKSISG